MAILDKMTDESRLQTLQRFEDNISPVPESGCWLWTAACLKNNTSYGYMKVNNRRELAHRISYELFNSPIPDGALVLHRCDVQSCANPSHLFLGTQLDNITDMNQKGRAVNPKGEKNGNSKLTEKMVSSIRSEYIKTHAPTAIGKKYGVTKTTVYNIINGRCWRASQ